MVTRGVARRQSLRRRVTTRAGGHASLSRCGCLRSEVDIFRTPCRTYWCSRAGRRASRRRAISRLSATPCCAEPRRLCDMAGAQSTVFLAATRGNQVRSLCGRRVTLAGEAGRLGRVVRASVGGLGLAKRERLATMESRITGHHILGLTRHLHGRSEYLFFRGTLKCVDEKSDAVRCRTVSS
jgi:hypothetical protein